MLLLLKLLKWKLESNFLKIKKKIHILKDVDHIFIPRGYWVDNQEAAMLTAPLQVETQASKSSFW